MVNCCCMAICMYVVALVNSIYFEEGEEMNKVINAINQICCPWPVSFHASIHSGSESDRHKMHFFQSITKNRKFIFCGLWSVERAFKHLFTMFCSNSYSPITTALAVCYSFCQPVWSYMGKGKQLFLIHSVKQGHGRHKKCKRQKSIKGVRQTSQFYNWLSVWRALWEAAVEFWGSYGS